VDSEPFVILVADRDATVGVISSMLLSSALATERAIIPAQVRVLVAPEFITVFDESELPEEVRKIEEQAMSATRSDIEAAKLIVAFSGIDIQKLNELREAGIGAPAVNLCQFVDNLDEVARRSLASGSDIQDVIVDTALQFGINGGSSICKICEATESENVDYWVRIADTCSRFAQTLNTWGLRAGAS
jgi:hypothetical protein